MKKSHRVAHEKIRGVVGSVTTIIQLLLRLSRFLFAKKNTSCRITIHVLQKAASYLWKGAYTQILLSSGVDIEPLAPCFEANTGKPSPHGLDLLRKISLTRCPLNINPIPTKQFVLST